jgi:hypothetical protein
MSIVHIEEFIETIESIGFERSVNRYRNTSEVFYRVIYYYKEYSFVFDYDDGKNGLDGFGFYLNGEIYSNSLIDKNPYKNSYLSKDLTTYYDGFNKEDFRKILKLLNILFPHYFRKKKIQQLLN